MCKKWKDAENIHRYSAYTARRWSPPPINLPNACSAASASSQGVTDKGYITNSYHVHVTEKIDAFDKLKFESQFQALSTGGAISYVEVPEHAGQPARPFCRSCRFIYDNIMYAELNTKSDYCQECGYDG